MLGPFLPMPAETSPPPAKILLIGWELADWKLLHPLLDGGFLPNLDRLINSGVMADLSPASWREMAMGVADQTAPELPLWAVFANAGRRCLTIRWPGSHPAVMLPNAGVFVSDEFNRPPRPEAPAGASIEPAELREPLEALRVNPTGLDLNDIRRFVPTLDRLGEEDRPMITWLAQALADAVTTHKAAAWLLETQAWDFAMLHLGALGAIGRQFLPISQKPDSAYGGVPTGAVILADQMLGRLGELAGPGTIVCVCSAYGLFGSAMAVLAGPGIRQDERLEEKDAAPATAVDIGPTLCALGGVPVPAAYTGRDWDVRAAL
jgi:hypothetical protein